MNAAMGQVVDSRSSRKSEEVTAWIGMVVFLLSWAMMFGSLFFVYAGIRSRAAFWPPPGLPHIPLFLPAINTLVIGVSSAMLHYAVFALKKTRRGAAPALAATLVLGIAFLALQTMVWVDLLAAGLSMDSGPYASAFYGLTYIHAAHVVIGLGALLWLTVQAFRGQYTAGRHLTVRLWSMYWHFVGIIWVGLFLSVYAI